jgi:hypothetical protein
MQPRANRADPTLMDGLLSGVIPVADEIPFGL